MVFPSSPRRRLGLLLALVGAVSALLLWPAPARSAGGYALRFYGHGVGDIDRVKVPVDDPATSLAGPPVDVGATDFTFEFWLKGTAAANSAPAVTCGANINWIYGNIVLDRDRYSQDRKFGVSLGAGRVVFGVSGAGTGDRTLCGTASLLDGQWHHVAVQRRRSDGWLWIYVDGVLQANVNGPDGDVSYPDDGVPGDFCGGPCVNSDPYLVLAAEKHDAGGQFPSFSGWLDELRVSTALRYSGNFTPAAAPFTPDASTAALYHFDEGPAGACTGTVLDSSGAAGGPSNGQCRYGGAGTAGPVYTTDSPFSGAATATGGPGSATPTRTATPSRTPTRTPTPVATSTPFIPGTGGGVLYLPLLMLTGP